jgi:hypothetical protein
VRSKSVKFRHDELNRRLEIGNGYYAYLSIQRLRAAGTNAIIRKSLVLKRHHIIDLMGLLEAAAEE